LVGTGLAVCHIGIGAVWIFNSRGEPELRINSCAGAHTTNVAYGGQDLRTLFITEAEKGVILKARTKRPGALMFGLM